MESDRKGFWEMDCESLRGQLSAFCNTTMEPMAAGRYRYRRISDDWIGDLHEEACRVRDEADNLAGETGVYPDAFVLRFLKRIAWATERLRHSNTGTTGRLD